MLLKWRHPDERVITSGIIPDTTLRLYTKRRSQRFKDNLQKNSSLQAPNSSCMLRTISKTVSSPQGPNSSCIFRTISNIVSSRPVAKGSFLFRTNSNTVSSPHAANNSCIFRTISNIVSSRPASNSSCIFRTILNIVSSHPVANSSCIIWDRYNLFEGRSPIMFRGRHEKECIFVQVLFKVWFKFYYLAGVISLWLCNWRLKVCLLQKK